MQVVLILGQGLTQTDDSIATLNLVINSPTSSTTNESACDSYTWNGVTYNASGTLFWTGVNSNGCDSIATLNLVINSPTTSTANESACTPYT